jgi:hypothetical protein
MVLSTNDKGLHFGTVWDMHWSLATPEEALAERDGHQMLRDDGILPADEYYHVLHSTSNAPEHYKYPMYASLVTVSSRMASAAAMITSRTVACVQATLLLRTRSRPSVEVVLIPDIVTTLNRPMFVHGSEVDWIQHREKPRISHLALFRASQA